MKVDFSKYSDGLVPAVVQDFTTSKVLMLGFMNEEALKKTEETARVTFYSRSKKRLWTKGEESGNFLQLKQILVDCDNDTLLVKALPDRPSLPHRSRHLLERKKPPCRFFILPRRHHQTAAY